MSVENEKHLKTKHKLVEIIKMSLSRVEQLNYDRFIELANEKIGENHLDERDCKIIITVII